MILVSPDGTLLTLGPTAFSTLAWGSILLVAVVFLAVLWLVWSER